jgi:paraquat-inducible protein A
LVALPAVGSVAHRCPRCGAELPLGNLSRVDHALALHVAAAVCFLMANCWPIVALEAAGNRSSVTLLGAAWAMHAEHMNAVAALVAATTVFIPAIDLLCTGWLLVLAGVRRASSSYASVLRVKQRLTPWSMTEIFVLGSLVAIIKLGSLAGVIVGVGLWSLGAFIVLSAAVAHMFIPRDFWIGRGCFA